MSKLAELIMKLCPNGVEYRPLGKIAVCQKTKNKAHITEAAYSITQRGLIPTSNYFGEKTKITSSDTSGYYLVYKDWFVYSPSRIDVGSINYLREDGPVIVSPLDVVFSVDAAAIRPDFLLIYLTSHSGMFQILSHRQGIEGTGRKTLPFSEFAKIKVPVPPIEVQDEILCTLGKFTGLIFELTAELAARKKQYEYYRDKLLTFGVLGVGTIKYKWRTLAEIADIGTGSSNTNEGLDNGLYPFFVRSQEPLRKNEYEFDETAIITAGDGVGVGKVYHFVEGKYALHQRAYRIHVKTPDVMPKYYFHYMQAMFLPYIQKTMFQGSVASIRRPMLNEFPVPIPPIDVQQQIINILDRFDTLCNDLTSGLPAEIAARQKQYEYYRDKLLTFRPLSQP